MAWLAWGLDIDAAALFDDRDVRPPPTGSPRDQPEGLRIVVAANTRRAVRLRYGDVSISEVAAKLAFERSGLYDVLAARVDISISRLARLAALLDETPGRMLRA